MFQVKQSSVQHSRAPVIRGSASSAAQPSAQQQQQQQRAAAAAASGADMYRRFREKLVHEIVAHKIYQDEQLLAFFEQAMDGDRGFCSHPEFRALDRQRLQSIVDGLKAEFDV